VNLRLSAVTFVVRNQLDILTYLINYLFIYLLTYLITYLLT